MGSGSMKVFPRNQKSMKGGGVGWATYFGNSTVQVKKGSWSDVNTTKG